MLCLCGYLVAPQLSTQAKADAQSTAAHDSQHDFDFEIGTWNTHLRRLVTPLGGSSRWIECDGTTVVRKVWGGARIWSSFMRTALPVISRA